MSLGASGAFDVAFGSAEAAGVLVDVEQQHEAATQLVGDGGQAGGDVAEDRGAGFGVGAAAPPQPAIVDDGCGWWVGPGVFVAEGRGVQAGVKHPAGAGPRPGDFAGQADGGAGGVAEHPGAQVALYQPGAEPLDHRVVGVDAAPAGDGD